ncbi:MAG TPA: tRNA (guanosine(37)-N1)-methyltransferase TrmD [Persephonella sp.]|uniref:tRNA (guanine-N(1)-)-methyltransferase n=1 Tax=Persephonella marina (strain DSM 14350 / EX-H1) TaxID=123214 RepID=TRMD_PERMH|nr:MULTISPECIES: tRNA (guanosine(37)-N1)-methyltransferase TrmD [Persephonella]C0QQJ9.1 RecName: Full=tRNA (guanine-N(1)-)-methyltransferase; AltName: Full=M1G-methyltransferase; AltName: Full=tRNA [GM37] methyltransferase [Persephonella marina EX-H1]ACO04739.1 tRNA (guanine-N1)-methyltransferase [Persephonella marina EX-H1]HCB69462.1 tRNA (guanosine(37)-N1)-methyltransferase TrmD [Persephonella sp.]
MKFFVLTIFPQFFEGFINTGIVSRAVKKGIVDIKSVDLRDFTEDKHRTVDDVVYGGGPGMLLKPEPIFKAYDSITEKGHKPYVLITEPWGRKFDQKFAEELSKKEEIMIICGRYEGVDERVKSIVDEEVSIGDFILSGGEPAALVIMDAVIRLIPGVVGDSESLNADSFSNDGLLGYPNYTRPAEYRGMKVPEVLRSGNHKLIKLWRRWKQIEKTAVRKPELLKKADLSDSDKKIIDAIKKGLSFEDFLKKYKV